MALADLHVHSVHSEHPSEWFLQRIGAAESYTEPGFIYQTAKDNGMNFVTITDHNRISGALLLRLQHPEDVFVSVESTVYFPEDGCKVHILVFGLTERQFNEIQILRKDIYQFRDYLKKENLAYSVAHATYSVNGKLTMDHLEKLILLFDVFEGINGGRNQLSNDVWTESLHALTPEIIGHLYNKHHIEPISEDPWIKGFTGGSDDHAGFFIAKTYTFAEAESVEEFLKHLKNKKTMAGGRHNDFKSLAFTIYKIAYDFSKTKSKGFSNPIIKQITDNLFDRKPASFMDKFNVLHFLKIKKNKTDPLKRKILEAVDKIKEVKNEQNDVKFEQVYQSISEIADDLFIALTDKMINDLNQGDFINIIRNVSLSLPGIFLSLPFFTTLKHMFSGRPLLNELRTTYTPELQNGKRVLWFSDTVTDLNGVSFIVKRITSLAEKHKKDITLVCSINEEEQKDRDLPVNYINLPAIYAFNLPHYESYTMRIPSILQTLEIISQRNPDEIMISTPGPVGLIGLFMAKLLNIPVSGIYHTDFKLQLEAIDDDSGPAGLVEAYTRWFYMNLDSIRVPTEEYIRILTDRGFEPHKMSVFKRGIETEIFHPIQDAKTKMRNKYGIPKGIDLLFSGRISKDKNIEFMVKTFMDIYAKNNTVNLIIAGDGPFLPELKKLLRHCPSAFCLGKIERSDLALLYSGCDLFYFPSNTDTFGMVVLEAQACGLPALVSDKGGPKEIVINNETGWVIPHDQHDLWVGKTLEVINNIAEPEQYRQIREKATEHVHSTCHWQKVLEDITIGITRETMQSRRFIPKW